MRAPLKFRVRYKGALGEKESGVRLDLWSTTIRSDRGYSSTPVVWDDAKGRGAEQVVEIPIASPTRDDDALWAMAVIFAPGVEGVPVGSRGGVDAITLRSIAERLEAPPAGKKPMFKLKLRMTQPGVSGGKPYVKGVLHVLGPADEATARAIRSWRFPAKPSPFSLLDDDNGRVSQLLEASVNAAMFPYTDTAAAAGMPFEPSNPNVRPIHAPVWPANVGVPGWAFWIEYGEHDPPAATEAFMENLARTALARHGWTAERFIGTVDGQFRRTGADDYDDEFTRACALTMSMCAIPAVSLRYKFDEAYVVTENILGVSSTERREIESFHDALCLHGGDCEDLGCLIHRVVRLLQMGMPVRRDGPGSLQMGVPAWRSEAAAAAAGQRYWRAYGGWGDGVLDRMQRLAYWYVSGGSLGSVTSARLETPKEERGPLIIDSTIDNALQIGGHMWQESIPVAHFEDMLARTNSMFERGTLRPAPYPAWMSKMPHTVGEGTGSLYPLVLPLEAYMHTPEGARRALEEHRLYLRARKYTRKGSSALRALQMEQLSDRAKRISDARVNWFYRRTTSFFTDNLALWGIPFFEFMFARLAPRGPERSAAGTMIAGAADGSYTDTDTDSDSSDDADHLLLGDRQQDDEDAMREHDPRKAKKEQKKREKEDRKKRKKGKKKKKGKKEKKKKKGKKEKKSKKKRLWKRDAIDETYYCAEAGSESESDSATTGSEYSSASDDEFFAGGGLRQGMVDRASAWKYGVDMRDKIFANRNPEIGLVATPPASDDEMRAIKSLLRHLPPWKIPRRTEQRVQEIKHWAEPQIREFRTKLAQAVRGRRAANATTPLTLIMRESEFFQARLSSRDEKKHPTLLRDSIVEDIARLDKIVHAEVALEVVEDSIYNVRLIVHVSQ